MHGSLAGASQWLQSALEQQPDLSAASRELTRCCRLDEQVKHLTGDFLALPVQLNEYDAVVGLLCFLHVGNWLPLFQRCSSRVGSCTSTTSSIAATSSP